MEIWGIYWRTSTLDWTQDEILAFSRQKLDMCNKSFGKKIEVKLHLHALYGPKFGMNP